MPPEDELQDDMLEDEGDQLSVEEVNHNHLLSARNIILKALFLIKVSGR